jgi:hypothetical protein
VVRPKLCGPLQAQGSSIFAYGLDPSVLGVLINEVIPRNLNPADFRHALGEKLAQIFVAASVAEADKDGQRCSWVRLSAPGQIGRELAQRGALTRAGCAQQGGLLDIAEGEIADGLAASLAVVGEELLQQANGALAHPCALQVILA